MNGVKIINELKNTSASNERNSGDQKETEGGKSSKQSSTGAKEKDKPVPRCIECNVKLRKSEAGSHCPPGPVDLGFKPGLPCCKLCIVHFQKRHHWFIEDQEKRCPKTKQHST